MMKRKRGNILWGVCLILIGGFFFAVNTGMVPELSENLWAILFILVGLTFFASYFASGVNNWGLLFPATGALAVGITIWLATGEVDGTIIGGLFMLLVSIPFWVGYLANRKQHWGLLIPGWGTTALGTVLLIAGRSEGELIGTLVMFAIALPFLVVYLTNRKHWWALIPSWVLAIIGVIILFANTLPGEFIGALVLFAIALPFFVVYFADNKNWWALIPAGIVASVGATVLLAGIALAEAFQVRLLGSALFAGIGATFAALWLLRQQYGTEWAKYPAIGLGGAALLVILFGAEVEVVWSIALIALGVWLLYRSPRPHEKL